MAKQPPYVPGVMELLEADKDKVRTRLLQVLNDYVPTDDNPQCDTFRLVVGYHQKYSAEADYILINGDTAEYVLQN